MGTALFRRSERVAAWPEAARGIFGAEVAMATAYMTCLLCQLWNGRIKDGHARRRFGSCRVTARGNGNTQMYRRLIARPVDVESASSSCIRGNSSNHGADLLVRGFTVPGARSMTSGWHSFCSVRLCLSFLFLPFFHEIHDANSPWRCGEPRLSDCKEVITAQTTGRAAAGYRRVGKR
jgi:hypothetical protein